ncbi:MAG: TatD family hydrolase [Patescibacteria group bacterium]|jgi:TatD DNase family protein
MFSIIDTHSHVHFPVFDSDIDEVMARVRDRQMGLITVGAKFKTSASAVEFAENHEDVWATIGLYPGHVHDHGFIDENEEDEVEVVPEYEFDEAKYATLVVHPKVVGIGEFGLDYSRVPEGMDIEKFKEDQRKVARQQLRFATKFHKPVVIHCRGGKTTDVSGANDDMRMLIEEEIARDGLKSRGVIHSFTGTVEDAKKYADLGFFISVTGIVTFAKSVADAIKEIPLEQMMVETDCPYLSPVPNRGKRNEPVNVILVARAIADLKGIAFEEVARVTTENAKKLFGLS